MNSLGCMWQASREKENQPERGKDKEPESCGNLTPYHTDELKGALNLSFNKALLKNKINPSLHSLKERGQGGETGCYWKLGGIFFVTLKLGQGLLEISGKN